MWVLELSSPGLLKNGKINICTSTGSRENNQNKVNTQLWDTLYVDGPVEAWILDIGYGLQIWRSNDTSSNIVSIRMFHAHQSVSSASASSSKLMYDISRKLPAANHMEGEVSLSLGRHWDWLRLRKWYGVELSSAAAGRGGWTLGTAAAVNQMDAK